MTETTAEKLRRLADACERDVCEDEPCAHDVGTVGFARLLADEHDALKRVLAKFEAYTTADIETTLKAECHRVAAATEEALRELGGQHD